MEQEIKLITTDEIFILKNKCNNLVKLLDTLESVSGEREKFYLLAFVNTTLKISDQVFDIYKESVINE